MLMLPQHPELRHRTPRWVPSRDTTLQGDRRTEPPAWLSWAEMVLRGLWGVAAVLPVTLKVT